MASVAVFAALQAKKWSKESEHKLMQESVWGQLTGKVNKTSALGNEVMKIPNSCIAERSKDFEDGVYSVTIPWKGKISTMGYGGRETLEGNEATIPMRYKNVFWNNQRHAVALEDESVEGSLARFYQVGAEKVELLENYFIELDDYNHTRAFLEGGDEYLTESRYWTNGSLSAPVTTALHPVWLVNGEAAAETWNATYATYEASIDDSIDGGTTSNVFDLGAADSIAFECRRRLTAMEGKYKYVAVISDIQADQLTTGASNAWLSKFESAGQRAMDNKSITGAIGLYRDVLYIVGQRNPVWNLANATTAKIVYSKPDSDDNSATGTSVVTRVTKGSADAGTGTAEIAMVMGKSALGKAKIQGIKYTGKKFDYDFTEGFAAARKEGVQRMDFTGSNSALQPVCNGSFVYTTCTPARTV